MTTPEDEKRHEEFEHEGVPLWARLFYVCALLAVLGLVWWLVIRFGAEGG